MERNYGEDQANEVEALESIYCDDIEGKVCKRSHSLSIDYYRSIDYYYQYYHY